ncbi:Serine/threonine-protein phosphatase 6 regulatory subunit 2 [Manis javanica]|nr:Serine/threonine-protein phosphatase 6 regulatory subunit 2 [Manis javanica]
MLCIKGKFHYEDLCSVSILSSQSLQARQEGNGSNSQEEPLDFCKEASTLAKLDIDQITKRHGYTLFTTELLMVPELNHLCAIEHH